MRRLFIMRKDLHMSAGKLAAQVGHCAEAFWTNGIRKDAKELLAEDSKYIVETPAGPYVIVQLGLRKSAVEEYVCGAFTKTICEAKNKAHLLKAADMAKELGLVENTDYGLIYDNCLTELEPEEENGSTLTGIWFAPLPDDTAHKISKKYQLYKD